MEFFEKIKIVRTNIEEWLKHWDGNDGFSYLINEFATENEETGECNVYISKGEHNNILEYLDLRGEIEVEGDKNNSVILTIPPKAKPVIRLKALELLAKDLKNFYTGQNIIDLLKDNGADQRLITYPESKWKIFYKVFSELSISQNKDDWVLLFDLICEALHPVNLGGDTQKSKELQEKYGEILKHDGLILNNLKIIKIEKKKEVDEKTYKESLFYLRLYYMKLLKLLEVVGGSHAGYRDQSLNAFYILLQDKIQKLLNQDFFADFQKIAPEMYDNLLGDMGDIMDSWEFVSRDLYSFFGQIEKQFILSEVPDLEIPEDLKKSFEHIDGKITEYKKTVDQQFAKMMENAKRNADEMMGNSQNNSVNKKQELSIKISEIPELKIQGIGSQKEAEDMSKINLSDKNISFDDDKAKIIIGKKECQLPAYKNEHYFCRAIFQHPVNVLVDWSIIFENMDKILNSGSKKDSIKDKRSIQDTMYKLNKRIKSVVNTDDDLFTWKNKSVKRNY